jgi:hypothetical protein
MHLTFPDLTRPLYLAHHSRPEPAIPLTRRKVDQSAMT